MNKSSFSRRDFLRLLGFGSGAVAFNSLISACQPFLQNAPIVPISTHLPPSIAVTSAPHAPLEFSLRAIQGEVSILPGAPTRVWQYQPTLISGEASALQTLPGSYLGPILHAWRGQTIRARLENEISEPTILHWHGLRIPEQADGHPRYAINTGETYDYEFPVLNRAGTYWIHPHPHQRTGAQAYYGMAGLFIVHDDEEQAAGLPDGEFDVPLIIQDRMFDTQNQLVYLASMMDSMTGFLGNVVLVNGQPNFILPVAARPYRLRLLNGSNARVYKLAYSDNTPLTVIATDGGLLAAPLQRNYVTLAPGERIELWIDFSRVGTGGTVKLVSLEFASGSGGMMGGGMSAGIPQGIPFDVMTFSVERDSADRPTLPPVLSAPNFYNAESAVNRNAPRRFEFAMQGMVGTINGMQFGMDDVTDYETVKLGDLEFWEFANVAGGGMGMGMMGGMAQPHPVHVHGVQFKIISRQIDRAYRNEYSTLSDGFVDDGWKDTVLVLPGETVQVLVRFEDYAGLYLYHCHNLEHEDGGMMRNYKVVS